MTAPSPEAGAAPAGPPLGVGDAAPTFTLHDSDGIARSLTDAMARGPVVLAFYRGHW